MGVMTAYSSHNSKTKTNVAMSEKAISLRLNLNFNSRVLEVGIE